ncbi:MAG: flagellar biosynthesis protein FlhF [Phycisphaerales bacterium JB040]
MHLKTFRARNMALALTEVRNALGPEAVILHTRTYKAGGLLGLGTRTIVEITASAPEPGHRTHERATEPVKPAQTLEPKPHTPASPAIEAEIADLRAELRRVMQGAGRSAQTVRPAGPSALGVLPEPLLELSDRLLRNDLPQALADELIGETRDALEPAQREDRDLATETLIDRLAKRIPTSTTPPDSLRGRSGGHTIALLGPTGVGKTTTIAKLAASAKLRHGLRVGLITSDTYRIAAVEQLRTYAAIIGVPLQVVTTPDELASARASLRHCELVLVDTAGRSQNDARRVGELLDLLTAAEPDEKHLVLSTTNSAQASTRIAERFCVLRPDHLILTKLDEAIETGVLAAMPQALGLPLSYVTSGQEVPDDIEPADPVRLARLVLHGPECLREPAQEAREPSHGVETPSLVHETNGALS